MSGFLAIDPGGPVLGWCWYEGGVKALGLSRAPKNLKTARERATYHRGALDHYYPGRVVCECMAFRYRGNKTDPQDLIDLNLIAGHLGTEWWTPDEWKGRTPKEIHQPRILDRLDPGEKKTVDAFVAATRAKTLVHNAIDAVGLALFAAGRIKR